MRKSNPTQNPVPSSDVRDLPFNASKIDEVVNSESHFYIDRLGNDRLTIKGLEEAATSAGPTIKAAAQAVEQANLAREAAENIEVNTASYIQQASGYALSSEESAQRAEAAANNATVNANVYPDIESGLAAVEDGQQFQVNSNDVITRYRRESEASAVEVASLFNKNGILNKIHSLRLPNMFEDGGLKSGVRPTLKTSASTYQLSELVEITDPYLKGIGCVNGVKPTGNYKAQILSSHTIPTNMYGKYVLMSAIVYSENGEFGHITNCSFLGDVSTSNILSLSYENFQRDISPTLRCYATLVKIPSDGSAISMHIGKANMQNAENAYITSICYVFSEGKLSLDEIKWDSPYSANDEFDRGIDASMLGFKKNVISWGGLDGGNKNPVIRSGSEVVKLSSQSQLTDRGYTNALRWRSGNEFVGYNENSLTGKYAGGYFLIYAENKDDVQSIVGADILCNSGSSVANIQRISRGVEVISKNLHLVWFSGFIDKDNVNQLWLGSSVAPVTTSRYATGFSLFIDDEPLDMWPIIRRISQINQTKLMIEQYSGDGIEPTKKSTVSLLGVDGISSVKCNNDTRIERQFILRKSESVTASTVFNFTKDIINDVVLREMVDDVAPYRTFGTTIGANHGYFMSLVTTSAAHGKSASDVGSVYTNGSDEFVIVEIVSATQLHITFKNLNTTTVPSGTYAHKSGGSNTTSFTTSAIKGSVQWYPPITNHTTKCLVDGREVAITGDYTYDNTFVVAESYDIISKDNMIAALTGGTKKGSLRIQLRYVFDKEGQCTIYSSFLALESGIPLQDIMFLQAVRCVANDGEVKYYIPKALPFTQFGKNFDYANIESSDTSGWTGRINMTPSRCVSSGILADRVIQLTNNYSFAMGFLPVYSASLDERRGMATVKALQLSNNGGKVYMSGVDKGDITLNMGDYFNVIGYRNINKRVSNRTCSYIVKNGDDYYLYADYHKAGLDSIELPDHLVGKKMDIVESSDNIQLLSKSAVSAIDVNVLSGMNNYLILKFS